MAGYPPPYPPPGPPSGQDWKYQRRILRDQARAQRDIINAQRYEYRARLRGTRSGSIVGPLLVVGIGIVFLLVQLGRLSFHHFGYWFGRFWPLLLVGIGVILLIEWVFDRNNQRNREINGVAPGAAPYVGHTIGGGVIAILVLIVIAGVGASGFNDASRDFFTHGFNLNSDNIDQFLGDKHESDQTLDRSFPANMALTVTNPRGDVTVAGTSDDSQIHITIHKEVFTRSDSDAEQRAKDLNPQINTGQNSFNLSMPSLEGARSDLIITVPALAQVTVSANHGDVHLNSLKNAVSVTANHGDVDLSGIGGAVTTRLNNGGSSFSAHNVSGPITLEGHGRDITLSDINGAVILSGEFFGTTHLERIRGTVKFHTSRTDFQLARLDGEIEISPNSDLSASQVLGPVTLITRNRNITLEKITGDLSVTNRNGSVDLVSAPPLGNVTIENRSGSVNLTVPEHSNFTVQAETTNGDIENDYSLPTEENRSRKKFSGTIGTGGSLIRINTSEGDISLKKANLRPLAPLPPVPPAVPSRQMSIIGPSGEGVTVTKDGTRIVSGADGSSVVIERNGTKIVSGPDGSSNYISKEGTKLTKTPDGSIIYIGNDGTRYTSGPDGSKVYAGPGGVRITSTPDGRTIAIGAGGKTLSESEVRSQLKHAEDLVNKASDSQRREASKAKENQNR
jgi:DUF4097 and DUF4098 domain-containing protein YvlB